MDKVLIMAAGSSKRWRNYKKTAALPNIKQLVPVLGQPLIRRTANQLLTLNTKPLLVTRDRIISQTSGLPTAHIPELFKPWSNTLLGNISKTRSLWRGQVAIMLGDVAWSDAAIEQMITTPISDYQFYGHRYETYALVIGKDHHNTVASAIERTLQLAPRTNDTVVLYRLRDLRWIMKLGTVPSPGYNEVECRATDPHFTFVRDWTQDIDHEGDYNNLLRKLKEVMSMGR